MNIPNTMMMKANSRFGWMRSESEAPVIIEGEAVVASAMGSSGSEPRTASEASRHHCGWIIIGESRSVSASASAAPSLVSTVV